MGNLEGLGFEHKNLRIAVGIAMKAMYLYANIF